MYALGKGFLETLWPSAFILPATKLHQSSVKGRGAGVRIPSLALYTRDVLCYFVVIIYHFTHG